MSAQPADIQGTRWRGASRTLRSLQTWLPTIGGPISDFPTSEQHTLRARSRDAYRGNMIARAAVTRSRTSVVGTGLICRPSVNAAALRISPADADALNATLGAHWEAWAEDPVECDIEATHDIYGLQAVSLVSSMCSGDVFGLTPDEVRTPGGMALKIQLIEADRISNPYDQPNAPTRVDGIEIRGAKPIGCWIRNTHPGEATAMPLAPPRWDYYPMFGAETGRRRVLHIWNEKDRPGQVRGAPYLAPILEPLKQLERFSNAELMAAVLSAMLTVFIEKSVDNTDPDGNAVAPLGADPATGNIKLGNGAIVDLAVGEKATVVDPTRPNANFDPFFVAIVKQIGAALEIPLDELLLQYNASYSAARAAMLQAWRFFLMRRWLLVQQFCTPIYSLFVDELVASGRVTLPGYSDPMRRRAYTRAIWIGPARGSMDEWKEANAAKTRIDMGVSNETMETAAMNGENWSEVYAQRAREIAQRKADGNWPSVPTAPARTASPPFADQPNADPAQGEGVNDAAELEAVPA